MYIVMCVYIYAGNLEKSTGKNHIFIDFRNLKEVS